MNFVDFLRTYMERRVCVLDDYQGIAWKRDKFNSLEEAITQSLFTFIYVTNEFVDDKRWGKYKQNAALAHSIENDQDHVIPVNTDPKNVRLPFALLPLRPVNLGSYRNHFKPENYHTLDMKTSGDSGAGSFHSLSVLKAQIEKLIGSKDEHKREREAKQKKELDEWLDQERLRRFEAKLREKADKQFREERKIDQIKQIQQNIKEDQFRQESERIAKNVPDQKSADRFAKNVPGVHSSDDLPHDDLPKVLQQHLYSLQATSINFDKPINISINYGPHQQTVIKAPVMRNLQVGEGNNMGVYETDQQPVSRPAAPERPEEFQGENISMSNSSFYSQCLYLEGIGVSLFQS